MVDFLVVGAQKSGTTALYSYLSGHKDIKMANIKEVHFFDNELNFHATPDYTLYHQYFPPLSASKQLRGEVTPIYMYWEPSMRRIWEYNKDIKIIILLRNPIDRAFSHWNMEKNRGAENSSFSDAIRTEQRRSKESLPEQHRVYSYIDRGFYTEQLRRVYRFFHKKSVLVLKYEELLYHPNEVLSKISNFLQIQSFSKQNLIRVHTGNYLETISEEDYEYLKNIYKYEIKSLEKLLNWDCSLWL